LASAIVIQPVRHVNGTRHSGRKEVICNTKLTDTSKGLAWRGEGEAANASTNDKETSKTDIVLFQNITCILLDL